MRAILAHLFLVVFFFGCSVQEKADVMDVDRGHFLLGPEAFEFCGGWVEIWGEIESSWRGELFVKVTPPAGANFKLWNAHVVAEDPQVPNQPIRFRDHTELSTDKSKTNVITLSFDSGKPPRDLKVALQPFEGCQAGQAIRGVVLKRSKAGIE